MPYLSKITHDRLNEHVVTTVNRLGWTMLIIRNDKTKICKTFVNTDKDLDKTKNFILVNVIPSNNNFAQTRRKEMSRQGPKKWLDTKTDRMTERQLYADFAIDFEKA